MPPQQVDGLPDLIHGAFGLGAHDTVLVMRTDMVGSRPLVKGAGAYGVDDGWATPAAGGLGNLNSRWSGSQADVVSPSAVLAGR